jgi:hypothetical protein
MNPNADLSARRDNRDRALVLDGDETGEARADSA